MKWRDASKKKIKIKAGISCLFVFFLPPFVKVEGLDRNHGYSSRCLTVKRSPEGAAEFLPSVTGKGNIPEGLSEQTLTRATPVHWNRRTGAFKRV